MKLIISFITLLLSTVAYGEYRHDAVVSEGASDLSQVVQHAHGEDHDDEPEDDDPEGDEPEDDEPEDDDPGAR